MILLDSDHLTVLTDARQTTYHNLVTRLEAATDPDIRLPICAIEEQLRGWLAYINRKGGIRDQLPAYERLTGFLRFMAAWRVANFDEPAADRFEELRRQRVRIGTMDLKIAAIALSRDALLLSANLSDYRHVPNLRVENWLV